MIRSSRLVSSSFSRLLSPSSPSLSLKHFSSPTTSTSTSIASSSSTSSLFPSHHSYLSSPSLLLSSSSSSSLSFPLSLSPFSPSPSRSFGSSSSAPSSNGLIDFNLADIGEGIAECEVLRWFVAVGDTIHQFDKVCEVQSDKANVEITSRYDGVITELKYQVGQLAKVGKPLLTLKVEVSDTAAKPSPPSPSTSSPSSSSPSSPSSSSSPSDFSKVLTSPAVRRIAREENVNLHHVSASGPNGRILKEDVVKFISNGKINNNTQHSTKSSQTHSSSSPSSSSPSHSSPSRPSPPAPASSSLPPSPPTPTLPSSISSDEVHAITGLNRIMVTTMNASNAVPQLGYADEFNLNDLVLLREKLKTITSKMGVKLTYLPFIIKATSMALKDFPHLNAHTNSDCSAVTWRSHHNIGIAMDTPRGLLVPNIKNCESKSILEIQMELSRLMALGLANKLGKDDLTGGTYTISNIGTIGGTYLSPLLVVPEVVICALGSLQTLPRYNAKGEVIPVNIMNLSWSADHRVVDGASIARFAQKVKLYLQQPDAMMIHLK